MRRALRCLVAGAALPLLFCCRATGPDGPGAAPPAVGFDPAQGELSWVAGDRAVYEVRYLEPGGERRWWIELELGPASSSMRSSTVTSTWTLEDGEGVSVQVQSPMWPATLRVLEEGAAAERVEAVELPTAHLARGLYPTLESAAGWLAEGTTELSGDELRDAARDFGAGVGVLLSFLRVVEESEELSAVLKRVVRAPSLLSLAFNLGTVDAMVEPRYDGVRAEPSPLAAEFGEARAYALPGLLSLNGAPGLEFELLVLPPRPPLHIAGGLVALEGRHPGRPERRVLIELVGARRGP